MNEVHCYISLTSVCAATCCVTYKVAMHSNWMSGCLTLLIMLVTGEFFEAIAYLQVQPQALTLLVLSSVVGYTGVVSFLYLVQSFGAKNTVIVTSTRKVFTILVSIVQYSKPFHGLHALGLTAVTTGVSSSLTLATSRRPCCCWCSIDATLYLRYIVCK